GGHGVTATGGPALTTTVRVVHRVHHDTADARADAQPPLTAGLAPGDVALLGGAGLAGRGAAAGRAQGGPSGRTAQVGQGSLLGAHLHRGAGGAGELGAAAGTQLDGVQRRTDRDVAQGEVVARLDVGPGTVLDAVALLQVTRREDVALLAV